MDHSPELDELRRRQEAALGVLGRGAATLEDGPEAVLAASPALRAELAAALGGYQRFKHERIFDPAIASGDDQRAALARHMKVACIAAGEVFRTHQDRWTRDRIAGDWNNYKAAARLTINQLRRHVASESEGIAELIETYGVR